MLLRKTPELLLLNRMAMTCLQNAPVRAFRQTHNLHEINYTYQLEVQQRTAKYLERTDKVYKPSKTIEFDRNGELMLYSCHNIRHNIIYFKYPYIMYDLLMPLSWYVMFVNPFYWKWQFTMTFFYMTTGFAWMPHVMYVMSLNKKIH